MDSLKNLLRRDMSDESHSPSMGSLAYTFFTLVLVASVLTFALVCLRRKRLSRRQRQQQTLLPSYSRSSHHRSPSMTNIPTIGRNDTVFVYDEKMNLIANSSSPPSSAVPEIHLTFPDDERPGQSTGRVVVVHVTDTGSVGMAPLPSDPCPPYQRSDAVRFQSLDLERIGGLREKESSSRLA